MRRPNAIAEARERRKRSRQPNPWLTAEVEGPPAEHMEVYEHRMAHIDSMSPQWRALVHRYGYEKTSVLLESGVNATVAWQQLESIRLRRQEQWLATDYILPPGDLIPYPALRIGDSLHGLRGRPA